EGKQRSGQGPYDRSGEEDPGGYGDRLPIAAVQPLPPDPPSPFFFTVELLVDPADLFIRDLSLVGWHVSGSLLVPTRSMTRRSRGIRPPSSQTTRSGRVRPPRYCPLAVKLKP